MACESGGKNTRCVHAGTYIDPEVGGVNTPIYASSSFLHPNPRGGEVCYPRYMNIPTQKACSDKIAALENAEAGLVVGSGMAAVSIPLMALLAKGDHAVFHADLYGGTHHFLTREFPRLGIECTLVHSTDPADFAAAARPNTKVLYVESPTNPLLTVLDLAAVARVAGDKGLVSVIDNTFATPINQTPLDLGFDVSVHSGTKYLAGHSDLNCGAIACSRALMEPIHATAVDVGVTLNVLDCYLLERSMKTLGLRMARHNANALAVARFLEAHPRVRKVNYPGLPSHPGHAVAARQMSGFGGMLSFELDATLERTEQAVSRLRVVAPAISLGGVESLVCFPARTSHSKMSAQARAEAGVSDTLLRLSVGVEDVEDIVADLEQALADG